MAQEHSGLEELTITATVPPAELDQSVVGLTVTAQTPGSPRWPIYMSVPAKFTIKARVVPVLFEPAEIVTEPAPEC
jgi:hypothetical protein